MFNLFRLLENETLKMFSIWERRKSRHKFGGAKHFRNFQLHYLRFGFQNISLFIAYENYECCSCVVHITIGSPSIISCYCVCFASFYGFFLFFLSFFVSCITCWGIEVSLVILKIKQWSCFYAPRWSSKGWVAIASFSN